MAKKQYVDEYYYKQPQTDISKLFEEYDIPTIRFNDKKTCNFVSPKGIFLQKNH